LYYRDVFICHANLDKKSHAKPLERALSKRGLSVWLDDAQIKPGDSLIQSIGFGLDKSKYVLLVITSNFLKRKWTETELNNALVKEISSGIPSVIPIIDGDYDEIIEKYPLLRDKFCFFWQEGIDDIAEQLSKRFDRKLSDWHIGIHPKEYTGIVWTRIIPHHENINLLHNITIIWNVYIFRSSFKIKEEPISLVHHKTDPTDFPLYVRVDPSAFVTVGRGHAPDLEQFNIDEGWTRLAGAPIKS